jgi:hypothetical protein
MFKDLPKLGLAAALWLSATSAQAQYTCFPTCAPLNEPTVDGKFLSLAGSALATFNSEAVTVVFGLPASATTVDFGIFDGDTTGQWESASGTINLTYTLFEDPFATGTGSVQVAQWIETDFTDNAWLDLSVPVGPGAQAPSGAYFYRLRIEASNAQPLAWTNFKVRTLDTNSLSLKPQAFNFTGARFTAADLAVIYPAFPTLTPTRYDGRWQFFARIGASTDTAEFWDGDLDRGSADCTNNDTDDPDTPGAPFLPAWAAGTSAYEGVAVGEPRACGTTTGSPPDDVDFASFLRTPSVSYTVTVPGDPTPYLNSNPSGNLEWERFVLTTIPGSVPATADHEVPNLPSGIYMIDMQGMDMRNFNSWFIPFDVLGVCEDAGSGDAEGNLTPCSPRLVPFLVGDLVWEDTDGNGVQDGGEPGIEGLEVCLLDSNGQLIDGTGDFGTGCTTTDATGFYQFEVDAGTYTVRVEAGNFDPGSPLENLSSTTGGETLTFTVVDENVLTFDFGYAKAVGGSIGDRVWFDIDRDGVQDPGEPGWNGRTVRLRRGGTSGTIIATEVTSGDGNYLFLSLAANQYTVEVVVSGVSDLVRTYDLDGTASANKATLTLAENQNRRDVDFGYAIKLKPIVECVIDNKDDTFTAYFGYQNSYSVPVTIPVGASNKFSPTPQDRGQPTTFVPGRTPVWPDAAFSATAFDWQTLKWTLDGKSASATDKSPPCSYHVFFEKEWVDADGGVSSVPPADISPDFEIYAESEIGKVHCYYAKDSTKLECDYWNQQPPANNNAGLWVPVGTGYWVTEKNLPPGWSPTQGAGNFEAPNAHCKTGRDGIENYCTHVVINSETPAQCADHAVSDPQWAVFFGNQALWLPGIATDLQFDGRGRLYEFANGTARLAGTVRSLADPKIAFEVDLTLTGKTTAEAPHKELKPEAYAENGGPIDTDTWYYYSSWEGSLFGRDDMIGADVWLQGDMAFQIGFGANGKNLHYGASAWLSYDVKSQPKNGKIDTKGNGDVNVDLEDCPALLAPIPD